MFTRRCGTVHYWAPEVAERVSETYSGAKADCWSAGVVLYNLLSGEQPFDDMSKSRGLYWIYMEELY